MAKILLKFTVVAKPLPTGIAAFGGKYLFKLGEAAQITDQLEAQFDGITEGASYAASCESLDPSNAPMGDAVSITVDVPAADASAGDAGDTSGSGTSPDVTTYPAPSALSFQIVS